MALRFYPTVEDSEANIVSESERERCMLSLVSSQPEGVVVCVCRSVSKHSVFPRAVRLISGSPWTDDAQQW